MLEVSNVSHSFNKRKILDRASFKIEAGEIVGLTGNSGVGKTTLARITCGLIKADAGHVLCDGIDISELKIERSCRIGMLFQSPRRSTNPRMKIRDICNEAQDASKIKNASFDRMFELCELLELPITLLDRYPEQVSEGQLQKACVVRSLLAEPKFLICDEATSMLDPLTTARIVSVLKNFSDRGLGIVVITHDQELMDVWADRKMILEAGQIIS